MVTVNRAAQSATRSRRPLAVSSSDSDVDSQTSLFSRPPRSRPPHLPRSKEPTDADLVAILRDNGIEKDTVSNVDGSRFCWLLCYPLWIP